MMESCSQISWNELGHKLRGERLSVLSVNMRSITNKFSEFQANLAVLKHRFTFILITETWLNVEKDYVLELDGYKSMSYYRDGRGGGLKLYYLEHVKVHPVEGPVYEANSFENISIRAYIPGFGKLNIGCFYRPPNNSFTEFYESFGHMLNTFAGERILLMGDFNIDLCKDCSQTRDYSDLFLSYGFSSVINLPTYVSPETNTPTSCLDHILHNLPLPCDSYVISPNLSDHLAISCVFRENIHQEPIVTKFRDFSPGNRANFVANLDTEFSSFAPPSHEPNSYAVYLEHFLHALLNKYFPLKSKVLSMKRLRAPWITADVIHCINKKHKLHKLAKRNEISWQSYKHYCLLVRQLLDTAEKEYYKTKFNQFGTDSKKNWRLINKLLNKVNSGISDRFIIESVLTSDPLIICNEFNRHFVDHPKNIADNIPQSEYEYFNLINSNLNDIYFPNCTGLEIKKIINNMKKNGNIMDIPRLFLADCGHYAADCLANFFNICIAARVYPNSLKHAYVTPVYKKGKKDDVRNHRPISIISNISKIFEEVIHNRLYPHFHGNRILSENQFGFRRGKSTELACLSLVDRVMPAFADKGYAIAIFLDFSACFDTINRLILLEKLKRYGIQGAPLELLSSYFSDRQQSVRYKNVVSVARAQDIGVIQGSKIGPLFFDIYSNDLNNICSDKENLLFADDTCLVYYDSNLKNLENHVNNRLKIIQDWCNFNRLSLNPSKSVYMLFTNRIVDFEPIIEIGSERIERKSSAKYLGLNIDEGLKFNVHIDYLKGKLSSLSGAAFKLRHYFNLQSAKKFYYACVYSLLTYCLPVYGGALSTYRGSLLIKKHEKIVSYLFLRQGSNDCPFKQNKLLKLTDVYKLYAGIHMFKILVLHSNSSVRDALDLQTAPHDYYTRHHNDLRTPFPRVDAIKRSFKYQFVGIWNEFPENVKSCTSLRSFKKELTNYLLATY